MTDIVESLLDDDRDFDMEHRRLIAEEIIHLRCAVESLRDKLAGTIGILEARNGEIERLGEELSKYKAIATLEALLTARQRN